jgi:uncharacterized membrane protein (UPF0182 family)
MSLTRSLAQFVADLLPRRLPAEAERLIASVGERVVMNTTVDALLADLFPGAPKPAPAIVATEPETGARPAAGPRSPSEALRHYRAAFRALNQGDWRTFGVEMDALRRALEAAPPAR